MKRAEWHEDFRWKCVNDGHWHYGTHITAGNKKMFEMLDKAVDALNFYGSRVPPGKIRKEDILLLDDYHKKAWDFLDSYEKEESKND